ncbi:MAG: hypothetical protein WKF97_02975 [Chitinophagaceae bacterium]
MEVSNPRLADEILGALLDRRGNSPQEMSEYLQVELSEVQYIMEFLRTDYKSWFDETKAYGRNSYNLIVRSPSTIAAFLEHGGFTKRYDKMKIDENLKGEDTKLLRENLIAVTAQAKQAIADSISAKRMAWLSLLFAFLAIVVSIILKYL